VGENRFLYRGIKYNIFGLIPKTSYVTQTLNIKYRGTIEPRATPCLYYHLYILLLYRLYNTHDVSLYSLNIIDHL
jgi:hypothetical protein